MERQFNFGTIEVGENGQITIPAEALEMLGIKEGDTLAVVGDEKFGLAMTKTEVLQNIPTELLNALMNGGAAEIFKNLTGSDISDSFKSDKDDDD